MNYFLQVREFLVKFRRIMKQIMGLHGQDSSSTREHRQKSTAVNFPSVFNWTKLLINLDVRNNLTDWMSFETQWYLKRNWAKFGGHLRESAKAFVSDVEALAFLGISFREGMLVFNRKTESKDELVFLFLDPKKYSLENMSWQLRIRRKSPFRELGFQFRYQDFYNRYRYRFEKDFIFFDKVVGGVWHNGIGSVPFGMEMGRWYDLQIETYEITFRCYVDGILKLQNVDSELTSGSVAIVLWETDGTTDLSADVTSLRLYSSENLERSQ